jgi:hypothetical protein
MTESRGPGRNKHKFAPCEDIRLVAVVRRHGSKSWPTVARQMPGRTPRQCRERWTNYINPNLDHSPLTPEEERAVEEKFNEYGPRWQIISSFFPGRSRNFLKNYCITKRKRAQRSSRANWTPDPLQDDSSIALPPTNDPSFDAFFPDAEKQDMFWERIAAEDF